MSDIIKPPIFISVLVPVLNEELYLEACVESILTTGYPLDQMEIILADGGSTDATCAIAGRLSIKHPMIRLVDNPWRNQAAGVNRAADISSPRSKYLIRLDAHALYPHGFLTQCVETAEETGAGVVVYVNCPMGKTGFQKAVAAALRHPLGVGGSSYRLGNKSGPVEHGQNGCFVRELFLKLGGYDPTLSPNEDSELSRRIRLSGATVWLDPRLQMTYFPRANATSLFIQYYKYGKARFRHLLKHRAMPLPRQALPAILIAGNTVCALIAIRYPIALLPIALYLLMMLAGAVHLVMKHRSLGMIRGFVIFPILHHAWGLGFWVECFKQISKRFGFGKKLPA